ncbi:1331_t:CDS:1, partial [Ambispora gerdemannii]
YDKKHNKTAPTNLLDIYYMATEEEKEELKKKMRLSDKSNPNLLQKYSLQEKKINNLTIVQEYLALFTRHYKLSDLTKLLSKSESSLRQIKQSSFEKLQAIVQERNLHFLSNDTFDLTKPEKVK